SSCRRASCSAGRAAMSPTAMRRSSSREMRLEIVITTPSCRRLAGVVGGARPDLLALVLLDVFEAIHDATAELDEARAFARPAAALKGAGADVPARGQVDLVEVFRSHLFLLRFWSKTCGDDGRGRGRSRGGAREEIREECSPSGQNEKGRPE